MNDMLVIPGKNWGWFDSKDVPIATGDNWHKWICPNRKWVYNATYENPYTDEVMYSEPYLEDMHTSCPTKSPSAKLEVCTRCGNKFVYP